MPSSPLISVITVTYNAARVVDKTLLSLQNQDFKEFEHLVVDGDSKDETLDIIKRYSLPQTRIISEPDKGLYDAMNKALRLAKGKYVIFLNAGDAFHSSDTLSLYASEAKKDRDIIYGDTIIVDGDGKYLEPRHLDTPQILTKKSFLNGMLICHQAFMVKKDLAPNYNLSYRFSADYDWCVKCISTSEPANCTNLHEVTIDFLSDGLTDRNKWKSLKERFRIMSAHYGLFPTIINHLKFISRALKRGHL